MPPKRSNKTARVLNLIAGGTDGPDPAAPEAAPLPAPEAAEAPQPEEAAPSPKRRKSAPRTRAAAEKAETPDASQTAPDAPQTAAQQQDASASLPPAPQPVVPIVQTVLEKEQALSDEIRSGLLLALEAESAPQQGAAAPAEAADEAPGAPSSPAAPMDEHAPDAPSAPTDAPAPPQSASPQDALYTPAGERDVRYVNVLQELVEDIAPYYIKNMLACPCARCVADMKALALTNLPSKYVVLVPAQKVAYMSVYESRYQNLIAVQMTRACVLVNEHPHH